MSGGDFWSKRRASVAAEMQTELDARQAELEAAEHAALEEKSDAEICAALNLPDVDALSAEDDFSAFMARAVPDRIRRKALRVLWRSNPVLANVDNLVDYGEDFTDSATVVENLQTAYQVGRGMLRHIEALAKDAEAEASETEETAPEVEAPEVVALAEAAPEPEAPTHTPEPQDAAAADDAPPPAPRRMRFVAEARA